MKSNFLKDISDDSISVSHTSSLSSQRLPFYVYSYGHFHALSSYFTEREGLDNYLLLYTLSGCGYLKYKESEYLINPGQAVVFNCFEYQLYRTASKVPWDFKWVHFGGASAKQYYDILNSDSLSIVSLSGDSMLNNYLDDIHKAITVMNMLTDIKNAANLVNIMTELISSKCSLLNNKKLCLHKSELDSVIDFIHTNYDKKICACDFISLIHMSRYHFIRLFKSYTGVSPYEYLINYRINISKKLLKETGLNINEIAVKVGFGDTNNFIRYFKRLSGTTPSNYRRFWIN